MKTHLLKFLMLSALVCAASAPTLGAGTSSLSDDRIKIIRYDENDVYTITTKFGYQTNVVFSNGESVETISVGDRSLWQIIPSGNRLFIRPMQQGISTNMTILTNKHAYQFDLKSIGEEDKDDKVIYVAKFLYAGDRLPMPPMELPPPPPPPPPPEKVSTTSPPIISSPAVYTNYNYTYSGPDVLAPLQVFDNGSTTFIKYLELPTPRPIIYIVGTDGKRTPVSAEEKGNLLAVSAVVGRLELESVDGTIVVYNETINSGN